MAYKTKLEAAKFISDLYLPQVIDGYEKHMYAHPGRIPNPWINDIEQYENLDLLCNCIEEYEIKEGLIAITEGE